METVGNDFAEWTFSSAISACTPLSFTIAPEAEAGHVLYWTASISCTAPETCITNNTVNRTRTIQSGPMKTSEESFEPNNMVVLHTGDPQTGMITHDDSTFSYLINFQNVTADTAHHVRIINTISPHLDITSVSGPFSLNPFKMYMPDGETIIFELDNIVLPDSGSSFIDSYGFIQYNIRMKPDLPAGTVIENQASVMYNRGETVVTNKVSNQIALTVVSESTDAGLQRLRAYPNPNNGSFRLLFDGPDNGAFIAALVDPAGKVVHQQSFVHSDRTELLMDARLASGVYLLTVSGASGDGPVGYERLLIIE